MSVRQERDVGKGYGCWMVVGFGKDIYHNKMVYRLACMITVSDTSSSAMVGCIPMQSNRSS